jgi:hypothetical protein
MLAAEWVPIATATLALTAPAAAYWFNAKLNRQKSQLDAWMASVNSRLQTVSTDQLNALSRVRTEIERQIAQCLVISSSLQAIKDALSEIRIAVDLGQELRPEDLHVAFDEARKSLQTGYASVVGWIPAAQRQAVHRAKNHVLSLRGELKSFKAPVSAADDRFTEVLAGAEGVLRACDFAQDVLRTFIQERQRIVGVTTLP